MTVGKTEIFLPLSIVKCDNIICVSIYANRMNSLVLRVRGDEVAHPGGHGGDLAGGASLDQFEVLLHGAVRVRVHVHARQIGLDQRHQPREHAHLHQAIWKTS